MTPNRKRVGLNPKQLEIMEQIRNLPEAEVAKGARILKKKLGLKRCYPVSDTSLDPDLFDPALIEAKGWSDGTIKRYTSYFLGIAKKKDESNKDARTRFLTVPHPFAPLVFGEDGKIQARWNGVFSRNEKPPKRLVSERLLLFFVLGLAIVKGTEPVKTAKNNARKALWKALGIRPATVVPISETDELTFWNSVTTPVPDPTAVQPTAVQPTLDFPNGNDVDAALELLGGSPLNNGTVISVDASSLTSTDEEDPSTALGGEDLMLKGLEMLTQGVHQVLSEIRELRAHERTVTDASLEVEDLQEDLREKEAKLSAREAELEAREQAMREKEAVLAQVLRVADGLRPSQG